MGHKQIRLMEYPKTGGGVRHRIPEGCEVQTEDLGFDGVEGGGAIEVPGWGVPLG